MGHPIPASLTPLLERNEVRVAGDRELAWIRTRIWLATSVIAAGSLYAVWWLGQGAWQLVTTGAASALWVAMVVAYAVLIPISAVGMNLSYHAYFTHSACKTSKPFQLLLGVLGALNFRGPVIEWAAHHRRHHKYTDIPHQDPHTPWQYGPGLWNILRGLWWTFLGEKLSAVRTVNETWAPDLMRQPTVMWLQRTYPIWAALSLVLPGAVAWLITGDLTTALVASSVLGCLRAATAYLAIAVLINGICHLWGSQPFAAPDQARNLRLFAIPTFGGSLHHNHHVFPKSLYVGLNGELDPFDALYWGLEKLGLIWDVHRPSPSSLEGKRRGPAAQPEQRAA